MPIQALVADILMDDFPIPTEDHIAQPWDCESRDHEVITMDRVSSSPWLCKLDGDFYTGRYLFTVDYTNSHIADDADTNNHMFYTLLMTAIEEYCSFANNRVRATSPALWVTGDGAPDFKPSQFIHSAEGHESYLDPAITFNNLYEE